MKYQDNEDLKEFLDEMVKWFEKVFNEKLNFDQEETIYSVESKGS